MPQAEEEIIISAIDIAEQIALIEARLERLKKKPGEEWLIHTSQKMLAYFRDRAAENDLAEQFLPQARIIVPLKKTRRRFIKSNTLLGRCKSRLDDIIRSQELKDKDWELRSPEELMEFLMDGILLGDPRKVAPRLSDVFEEIVEDLVRRPRDKELPPLPPNYDLTPISFDKHKMEVAASIQSFAQGTGATFSAHVESSLPLVMEDPVAIGPTVDELRPFLEPKMALSASAAFGIIAEILKLIPSDCHLGVRITTPCSGQYYCLSLIREHHSIADFNLGTGRLHVHEGSFVVGKDWPQPLSYLLAAGGRESGIDQISREVVASLGIEPKKESSSFDGAGYRTLSILLARFAYEDGLTVENGNRQGDWIPDWVRDAPDDWIDQSSDDYTLGQYWRIGCESTQRSIILDDEIAMLVGTTDYVSVDRDTRKAADRLERFLRVEDGEPAND